MEVMQVQWKFQLNEDIKTGAAYTTLQTHNRPHYYMFAADNKFYVKMSSSSDSLILSSKFTCYIV